MMLLVIKFLLFSITAVHSANILVVCPYDGKSHAVYIHSVVLGLAERGHNITMLTSIPIKNSPSNINQIVVNATMPAILQKLNSNNDFQKKVYEVKETSITDAPIFWTVISEYTFSNLEAPTMRDFIDNDNSKFDVVITEYFLQDIFLMFGYKYQAPVVLLAVGPYWNTMDTIMGLPQTFGQLGHEYGKSYGHELSFMQRVEALLTGYVYKLGSEYVLNRWYQNSFEKYFSKWPKPLPTMDELHRNVSLLLFNSHYSFDARPLVPGTVEIAGIHMNPVKELPQDIKAFLDGANDGFIYVSLGSRLNSVSMPKENIDAFLRAFGKLKQRVLWKWEAEDSSRFPPNVMTGKWLPQRDVLAHPKIKLFITHGGMLSTIETVCHGVPIIGTPVYGDQFMNVDKMVYKGMGIKLSLKRLNARILYMAINKVLKDPKYSAAAKAVSSVFNDRQNTPMETAAYWIEYVIRHKGGDSLKSLLKDIPTYAYYSLDIILVLCLLTITISYVFYKILKKILRKLCAKERIKTD